MVKKGLYGLAAVLALTVAGCGAAPTQTTPNPTAAKVASQPTTVRIRIDVPTGFRIKSCGVDPAAYWQGPDGIMEKKVVIGSKVLFEDRSPGNHEVKIIQECPDAPPIELVRKPIALVDLTTTVEIGLV